MVDIQGHDWRRGLPAASTTAEIFASQVKAATPFLVHLLASVDQPGGGSGSASGPARMKAVLNALEAASEVLASVRPGAMVSVRVQVGSTVIEVTV